MIAIIETGGKQYKVSKNEYIKIPKLNIEENEEVLFDKVLLTNDGKETKIGDPYLKNASVKGILKENGKDKKITVIKYKSKVNYFKKQGHRQDYSKVEITDIKS